jgi:acetylornithine deacetylase/succinyl-diaminopimelate desuccinylase-like protein
VSSASRQASAPRPPATPVEAVVPRARRLVDAPRPNPRGDECSTTDAARLHGLAGIPTLPALGPGLLAQAHRADEKAGAEALCPSIELYAELARAYCGGTS